MKVLICGAGIAGLSLANRLAMHGAEVVIVERSPRPRSQGYMIDFFGPGYDAAAVMGVLPAIKNVAYHIDEASLLDAHGRRRAGVRPALFGDGRLLDIMRPDLERVLRESLTADVDVRFGTGPVAVIDRGKGVRVTLDSGAELDADLLVGADGLHSTVRRLVFGEETRFLRYLGFHTAAFTFDAPEIHATVTDRACLTDTVDRQMGFYALRDGHVAAFAVHRASDPAMPSDIRAAVREAYGGLGWVVPQALDRCPSSEQIYYDQVAQIEMPSWGRGRVVLVGDACCAVSLIAGQGASLAIAGAYVLAEQLASTLGVEDAIAKYEKLWRPVVEEKQKVGRSGARWFLPSSAWQVRARRVVLRVARLPVVDRYVAVALAGKPTTPVTGLARSRGGHRSNPDRVMRAIFRAPVGLYGRNLGWLLGSRFTCVTHVGRRSGRRYRTVLEVIGKRSATGEFLVVAGMGPSSDWYRNIQANTSAEIVVGRRRFTAEHRVLDEREAAAVVADYERRNRLVLPIIRRVLSRLLGWHYDGTATARQRLVHQLPIVGFRPRTE